MQNSLAIENIDELRLEQGIDDVELHNEIRALQVGGFVKLTLLTGVRGSVSETLLFRITDRKGSRFRGELAAAPTVSGLSGVGIGSSFTFSEAHIHSVHHCLPVPERAKIPKKG